MTCLASGAAISGTPFRGVDARLSRYSYLVSLFPRTLLDQLNLDIELRARNVHPDVPDFMPRLAERVFPTLMEPLRSREEMRTLIEMTPSARHGTPDEVKAGQVTAAVDVTVFRRRDRPLPSPAADRDTAR